eukprot:gnl/TRDRNA2_/TRDRNA2_174194_c1_seq9.p1 gnl/TRDRNA2_/TRDRNA2_174194_c1~~gnl/TRDRNA2_/TRDRNA2_174194_c1_seq9.p1  ORF type:complete len:446 (+),score=55.07 gnl/TRDRNA2_/TRDRNA2_174194_c1_seq9:109-1446(+)
MACLSTAFYLVLAVVGIGISMLLAFEFDALPSVLSRKNVMSQAAVSTQMQQEIATLTELNVQLKKENTLLRAAASNLDKETARLPKNLYPMVADPAPGSCCNFYLPSTLPYNFTGSAIKREFRVAKGEFGPGEAFATQKQALDRKSAREMKAAFDAADIPNGKTQHLNLNDGVYNVTLQGKYFKSTKIPAINYSASYSSLYVKETLVDRELYKLGSRNSQTGQDAWVDSVLNLTGATGAMDPFVVESGANDGRSISNSLFFETARNYSCLLVEANPHLIPKILSLNRKCYLLAAGLSITGEIDSFPFMLAGPIGGILSTMPANHQARARGETKAKRAHMAGEQGSGKVVNVSAFPLHMVMRALGRKTIDYWSLDTEGSEEAIIKATDFSEIEVGVMTVEHNGDSSAKNRIQVALEQRGMKFIRDEGADSYYANPQFFARRGLQLP